MITDWLKIIISHHYSIDRIKPDTLPEIFFLMKMKLKWIGTGETDSKIIKKDIRTMSANINNIPAIYKAQKKYFFYTIPLIL